MDKDEGKASTHDHGFAADFGRQHPSDGLLFLNPAVPVTVEALDELPSYPTVLVVDDADQHQDDLPLLLTNTVRRSFPPKLILATRPHGTEALMAMLREAGYDTRGIMCIDPVPNLSPAEVEQLARQALGPDLAGYAQQLAHESRLQGRK